MLAAKIGPAGPNLMGWTNFGDILIFCSRASVCNELSGRGTGMG